MKNFSVSQLNTFLQCPYSWYLIYKLNIRTPKSDNLFLGSALHHGIAEFYHGKNPVEAFEEYIRTDLKHERLPTFDVEKNIQDGKELMEAYTKQAPYFEPLLIEERKEVDLLNPITNEALTVPFTFKIDLISKDELIIDHKSTTGNGLKQDELNRTQGISYYLAYRTLYGKRPRGFVQNSLLKSKRYEKRIVPLFLTYSVDDEVWFWKLARKVLDMIERREYLTARPMIKTFYPCPCRDICEIHGKTI